MRGRRTATDTGRPPGQGDRPRLPGPRPQPPVPSTVSGQAVHAGRTSLVSVSGQGELARVDRRSPPGSRCPPVCGARPEDKSRAVHMWAGAQPYPARHEQRGEAAAAERPRPRAGAPVRVCRTSTGSVKTGRVSGAMPGMGPGHGRPPRCRGGPGTVLAVHAG